MATYPFFIQLSAVLGANATATLTYQVTLSETITIHSIRQKSTGLFVFDNIRDSQGKDYSNSDANNPVPGEYFQDLADAFRQNERLVTPIVLGGGTFFNMDIRDTSGAGNTVRVTLEATRDIKGG